MPSNFVIGKGRIRLKEGPKSIILVFVFRSYKGNAKGRCIGFVEIVNNKADTKGERGRFSNKVIRVRKTLCVGREMTIKGFNNRTRENVLKDKEGANKGLRRVSIFYVIGLKRVLDGCRGLLKGMKGEVCKDIERSKDNREGTFGPKDIKEGLLL